MAKGHSLDHQGGEIDTFGGYGGLDGHCGGPLRTSKTTVLMSPDEGFDAMLLAQDAGSPGVLSAHPLTVSQNSPLLQRPQSEVSRDQPASSSTTTLSHPP